ncbi:MAG: Npun_F0494 family protein [Nodosilinea sp.]
MTRVNYRPSITSYYSPRALQRAERAFRCSPLRLDVLVAMRSESVLLRQICDQEGIRRGYTRRSLSELRAEGELLWLIAVGLLRREVDGQGLTDGFRLTPLGRQVADNLEQLSSGQFHPPLRDRLYNAWCRWLRLPGWLQS